MTFILFSLLAGYFYKRNNYTRLIAMIIWVWVVVFMLGTSHSLFLRFLTFLLYAGGVLVLFFFVLSIDNISLSENNPFWLFVLVLPLVTSRSRRIMKSMNERIMVSIRRAFLLFSLSVFVLLCLSLLQPALSRSIRN